MRQFEEQTKKVKEVTSIVCNKCGRVIPVIEGVPQEDVLSVDKRWGYFSDNDGKRVLSEPVWGERKGNGEI